MKTKANRKNTVFAVPIKALSIKHTVVDTSKPVEEKILGTVKGGTDISKGSYLFPFSFTSFLNPVSSTVLGFL